MISFKIAFINVLISLLYMLPGYILCKAKRATANHLSTVSAILIYACSPCMIVSSFISLEFNKTNLIYMGLFFGAPVIAKFYNNQVELIPVIRVLGLMLPLG